MAKLPKWATYNPSENKANSEDNSNKDNFLDFATNFLKSNDSENNFNTLKYFNGEKNFKSPVKEEKNIESEYNSFLKNNPIDFSNPGKSNVDDIWNDKPVDTKQPTKPKKKSMWQKIVDGLNAGVNTADKAFVDIPKNIYDMSYTVADKIGLIDKKDPRAVNPLDKASNYYGNVIKNYDDNNSGVAYNVAKFIPEAIGTGVEMGIPLPKVGSAGKVLDKFGKPVGEGVSNLVGKNILGDYLGTATKSASEFAGLNAFNTGINTLNNNNGLEQNAKDIGKSALEGMGQGALFGVGGKALGDLGKLPSFIKDTKNKTMLNSFDKLPNEPIEDTLLPSNVITPKPKQNIITEPIKAISYKPNDEILLNDNTSGKIISKNTDGTYKATVYTPEGEMETTIKPKGDSFEQILTPTPKDQIPIEDRNFSNVSKKEIKAYQYLHPELKPYIQSEADLLLEELKNGTKGERWASRDEFGHLQYDGVSRDMSQDIEYLLDSGHKYSDIERALNNIIMDHGKENTAVAKRIETILDERLSNGYFGDRMTQGDEIPANKEYINLKNKIENKLPIPSIGATDRVHSIQQIVPSSKGKTTLGNKFNNLYTHIVDVNHPIKGIDENTYKSATNSKSAGNTVDYIHHGALVDREGKKIGESLSEIAKDIPEDKFDFMNYVLQKHNIDRARENKPVYTDFTSEQSTKATKLIEQKHPEYKAINNRLVKFVNTFENEWGNKSGLISDDLWKSLQDTYKNYVPTQRDFTEVEKGISATNGKGFVDQSNSLKRATGSERDIIDPIENIMGLVNRTVRTARYNEVGQNMLKAIRKNPLVINSKLEIVPKNTKINPNVNNIVSVLEHGEPVNVMVKDKNLLAALQSVFKSKDMNALEKGARTLNNGFKSLITQKNPFFAVRNIARDIPTAYVNGSENNPIKFAGNLLKATKDIMTNSEIAQQYKGLGGEHGNFLNTDNMAKNVKDLTKKPNLLDFIGKLNNATESAPRLSEFKTTLKKGGSLQDALYNSADVTTNFSKGGDVTKWADNFVPYLNAGVQGLDKVARQFKDKPIATVLKGTTMVTAPTVLFNYINKDNAKYKELDNRTKDNYYLIPNGDTFIKIPKSRELGVLFGSLAERTLRKMKGEKNSFKGFANTTLTNFAPSDPIENNLISPLAYNIPKNKDFANRTIVPQSMQDRSTQNQWDEKTSEIGKKIGQLTKLSPKQIDYVIRAYTGIIGQLTLPMTTKANYGGNTKQNLLMPVTTQFTSDSLYSNQKLTDFYDNYDKIKTKSSDRNFTENLPSKLVTGEEQLKSKFLKASKEISDLSKQATLAQQKGDTKKARDIRRKIITIASESNDFMNLPRMKDKPIPMPKPKKGHHYSPK